MDTAKNKKDIGFGDSITSSEKEGLYSKKELEIEMLDTFGIPKIKDIVDSEGVDDTKIEKIKKKAIEFAETLRDNVQNYLKKTRIEEFSVDPEIQQRQIREAKEELVKISKYLVNETIKQRINEFNFKDEKFDSEGMTYVEILERTKRILSNNLEEDNKEKESPENEQDSNKELQILKENIFKSKNKIRKLADEYLQNIDVLSTNSQISQENLLKSSKSYENVILSIHKKLCSKITEIDDLIKATKQPSQTIQSKSSGSNAESNLTSSLLTSFLNNLLSISSSCLNLSSLQSQVKSLEEENTKEESKSSNTVETIFEKFEKLKVMTERNT